MIYIYVVLLINNHILVGYQNEPINGIKDINDINNYINDDDEISELIEVIKTEDLCDVDKTVKKYMLKYGINKVRGGSYNKHELDEWMIKSLEHEFKLLQPVEQTKILSTIDNYINNVTDIDEELVKIINIRQQLLKIKQQIYSTEINVDIDKTIEYQKAEHKIQELNQEKNKYYNHRNDNKLQKIEQDLKKLRQFRDNNQEHNQISIINQYYINYIQIKYEYKYIHETDISVQYYSLMIFNKEQKQKLKLFCEQHGTEDELLEKYKALLKKKMESIKN